MPQLDFLKDLLLANDPALVETVRGEAMLGNPHALYALGLIYAEGRGVPRNIVDAYAWLTVAVLHGDADSSRRLLGCPVNQRQVASAHAARLFTVLYSRHECDARLLERVPVLTVDRETGFQDADCVETNRGQGV